MDGTVIFKCAVHNGKVYLVSLSSKINIDSSSPHKINDIISLAVLKMVFSFFISAGTIICENAVLDVVFCELTC